MIRRFSIIGEAAKHLSSESKSRHKRVDWKNIERMRDFLVHEYFGIDLGIVWKAIKSDLPDLKKAIVEMIKEVGNAVR